MTQAATRPTTNTDSTDILAVARQQVLQRGKGLTQGQVLRVLRLPDDRLEELLALAHAYQQATAHHLKRPPMEKATKENAGL